MSDTRFSFSLEQNTNDLHLAADGNIATVTDALAVGQHVRQRLQTYSREWFLNTQVGVPWLEEILGYKYDPALAESVVKAEILNTDSVTAITSFSVGFDRGTRGLIIKDVSVSTTFGDEVSV